MEINDIIAEYTNGKNTLEYTNAALKEIGAPFHLDPAKNIIHPDEVGIYGLLDTGTGTYEKVKVENGRILGGGVGKMYAMCLLGGKVYKVVNEDQLTE